MRVQTVEEVFRLDAPILQMHVGGQIIETTAEHPFYVQSKGWTDGCDLQPGDLLIGADGNKIGVESIVPTGETKPVFNIRVSEDHTYFVGDDDWGFDVWVHNQYSVNKATGEVFHTAEDGVKTLTGHITKTADGKAIYQSLKEGAEPRRYDSLQKAYDDVSSGMANGRVLPKAVANIAEFFVGGFGETLSRISQKTRSRFQGQTIYKTNKKLGDNIKKGDYFYLDNKHRDHLEVFDNNGLFRHVLNLDGTINQAKTAAGKGRTITIK